MIYRLRLRMGGKIEVKEIDFSYNQNASSLVWNRWVVVWCSGDAVTIFNAQANQKIHQMSPQPTEITRDGLVIAGA